MPALPPASQKPLRVTVWNEHRHERQHPGVAKVYPEGIHGAIGAGLTAAGFAVRTATLDQPEHGLTEAVLNETDVLTWWGHMAHGEVSDAIVDRVQQRVLSGMGLIVLHSGHHAKIFRRLMGTNCSLTWREDGKHERVWCVNPGHPIAQGIGDSFVVPETEMYGEPFDVPEPDEQVFINWYPGGEIFRGGCCWRRGNGRIFFFSPGHETYPIYRQPEIRTIIANAVRWAAPMIDRSTAPCPNPKAVEPIAAAKPA